LPPIFQRLETFGVANLFLNSDPLPKKQSFFKWDYGELFSRDLML
jgi:hypothetical protein